MKIVSILIRAKKNSVILVASRISDRMKAVTSDSIKITFPVLQNVLRISTISE